MAKRGPKTKPAATGKPGPTPDPPDWIQGTTAEKHWHEFAPTLNALGLLESLDSVAFGLLCDSIAGYLHASEELAGQPLVEHIGEHGHPTQNPLVSIVRQQSKAVRELLSEFGMTPQSRTQLTGSTSCTPGEVEVDPLEALVARMTAPAEGKPPTPRSRKKVAKKKTAAKKKAAKKKTPAKRRSSRQKTGAR